MLPEQALASLHAGPAMVCVILDSASLASTFTSRWGVDSAHSFRNHTLCQQRAFLSGSNTSLIPHTLFRVAVSFFCLQLWEPPHPALCLQKRGDPPLSQQPHCFQPHLPWPPSCLAGAVGSPDAGPSRRELADATLLGHCGASMAAVLVLQP